MFTKHVGGVLEAVHQFIFVQTSFHLKSLNFDNSQHLVQKTVLVIVRQLSGDRHFFKHNATCELKLFDLADSFWSENRTAGVLFVTWK
jgi:hypothetical protein